MVALATFDAGESAGRGYHRVRRGGADRGDRDFPWRVVCLPIKFGPLVFESYALEADGSSAGSLD